MKDYLAHYQIREDGYELHRPLRLASAAEVRTEAESSNGLLIPEADERLPEAKLLSPEAHALVQCLEAGWKDSLGEALEPIYLREVSFVKAPPLRVFAP